MNRKGIIEDWIPLFVSLIIMIFIIVFFVIIKIVPKDDVILKGKEEIETNRILLNYLRSSAEIDNKELTFSEWINLLHNPDGARLIKEGNSFYYNVEYPSENIGRKFLQETKDYFDKISKGYEIKIKGEKDIFKLLNAGANLGDIDKIEIDLPHPKGDLTIELKINLGFVGRK